VLSAAGFAPAEITSVEEPLALGATVDDTVAFLAETGMGRAMLTDVDGGTRALALAAVADALGAYESRDGVQLGSRAWLVTAGRLP
jgi:hypothetical protein